jgi:hypothetical protein
VAYPNRFRGISLFSLAPVSEASMASGVSIRQRMLQFESTESNHMPADASEMAKLSTTGAAIPGTRAETQAWFDHAGIITKMIMGDACPVNRPLDTIRTCLRKPHMFVGWTDTEWKVLIWSSHVAFRAFMTDTAMAPLTQIAADMETRRRPDARVLPDEGRTNLAPQMEDMAGRKRPPDAQAQPVRSANQFGNPAADSLAAHLQLLEMNLEIATVDLKLG